MRWLVELRHLSGNGRLMADVLQRLSLAIIEEHGRSFLHGQSLDRLPTASDAYAFAKKLEGVLKETTERSPEVNIGLSIGNRVLDLVLDEPARTNIFLQGSPSIQKNTSSSGAISVTWSAEVTEEQRSRLQQEHEERQYQQLYRKATVQIVSAFIDERALTVQRLLVGRLEPLELGHIADIVEVDMGDAKYSLAPKSQWTRFYRSINHPSVFGPSARHIVSAHTPPPDPMTLLGARAFIQRLANEWLGQKLDYDDNA
jgi:hypothetical protein